MATAFPLISALFLLALSVHARPISITVANHPKADCTIRLMQPDGTDARTSACGARVEIRAGDLVWAEGMGTISPRVREAGAVDGDPIVLDPLVSSGRVRIAAAPPAGGHIEVLASSEGSQSLFRRPLAAEEIGTTIHLPRGAAVAIAIDEDGSAVALSGAARVGSNRVVDLEPVRPDDAVVFSALGVPEGRTTDGVALELAGEEPIVPAFFAAAPDEVIAIWREVLDRTATLHAQSESLILSPESLAPRPRRISTVRARLTTRPGIDVMVVVPETQRTELAPMTLRVEPPQGEALRELGIEPGVAVRIENLPSTILHVVLSAGGMRFLRRVDLTAGTDHNVTFELAPIILSGTVFLRDEPVQAELTFQREGVAPVRTGSDGNYEVVLWEPGMVTVSITTPERPDAIPFSELLRFSESRRIDFHLPSATATAIVTDAETGAPVAGANVMVRNRWDDETAGSRGVSQRGQTDATGIAKLPPLRAGTAEVFAAAEGYQKSPTRTLQIAEDSEHTIELALEPFGDGLPQPIVLPDGRPAAGAMVLVLAADQQTIFSGAADAEGTIEIPQSGSGQLLLIRHPAAGARATLWQPAISGRAPIALPPGAPPLTVRASVTNGPCAGSVHVWIDGMRLWGSALAFLTESSPGIPTHCTWSGKNLPAAPLRLLVAGPTVSREGVAAGAYDGMATVIPFPWRDSVSVKVVE